MPSFLMSSRDFRLMIPSRDFYFRKKRARTEMRLAKRDRVDTLTKVETLGN